VRFWNGCTWRTWRTIRTHVVAEPAGGSCNCTRRFRTPVSVCDMGVRAGLLMWLARTTRASCQASPLTALKAGELQARNLWGRACSSIIGLARQGRNVRSTDIPSRSTKAASQCTLCNRILQAHRSQFFLGIYLCGYTYKHHIFLKVFYDFKPV